MSEQRLTNWLRGQILSSKPAGEVIRIEALHIGPSGKYGNEISTVDAIPDELPDDWFGSVASELIAAVTADGMALNTGTQTYAICIYRKSDPQKIRARFPYRVDSGNDLEDNSQFLSSEPATKQGFLAQLMRHNEANAKILAGSVHSTAAIMQRALARLTEQNEKLQAQRIEQIELVERLLSHQLERELEQKKAEKRLELMDQGLQEVKLLAPAVVNRIAGKEIIPIKEDPQMIMLRRFIESLDDNQRNVFIEKLRPEQQALLAELFTALTPQ